MLMLLALPGLGAMAMLGCKRLYSSWAFGASIGLMLFLASAIAAKPMSVTLGSFNLYPEDAIFAALFAAATARLTVGGKFQARHLSWLLFGVATAASFIAGSRLYGVKPAGVEYRSIFYVVAGGLYCGSFRLGSASLKRFVTLWLWAGVVLLLLAWFRWAAVFLNLDIQEQWAGVGGTNPLRVLNASQALFLLQTFLATVYFYRHATARFVLGCFSAALLTTVILLQHRSVWVAALIACGVLAWRERARKRFLGIALVVLVVGASGYLLLSRYATEVSDSLRASAKEPLDPSRSTIAWRMELWQEYVVEFAALSGVQSWLGTGFGNPAIYQIDGNAVSNAAHNYYVYTLNRAGILGLLTLVFSYGMLLFYLRGTGSSWDYLGLFTAITATQLVFFMAYTPSFEQGFISGAVLGMIAMGGSRRRMRLSHGL